MSVLTIKIDFLTLQLKRIIKAEQLLKPYPNEKKTRLTEVCLVLFLSRLGKAFHSLLNLQKTCD